MRFAYLPRAESPRSRLLFATALLTGFSPAGFAIDYSAKLNINNTASYNDNLRMTEDDQTSVSKYQFAPALTLDARTPTTSYSLVSTLFFNRYDENQFDSDDQNIMFRFNRNFENGSSIGMDTSMIRESTITSEVLGSGLISDSAERTERYVASPYFSYSLSENNQLQLSGTYMKQHYRTPDYTGYDNTRANLDWIHVANERIKIVTSINYSDFQADDSRERLIPGFDIPLPGGYYVPGGFFGSQSYSTQTEDIGAQLGLDYQWSEQALIQARFGSTKSSTDYTIKQSQNTCTDSLYLDLVSAGYGPYLGTYCALEDTDGTSTTAELNWNWRNEKQEFSLGATKSNEPSSNGYVVDSTQLNSNWSYKLTERDKFLVALTLVRNKSVDEQNEVQNSAIADRNYESASLTYQRQLTERWFASAMYQYGKQKYNDIDYQATANVVSLAIRYQPQEWHWSR